MLSIAPNNTYLESGQNLKPLSMKKEKNIIYFTPDSIIQNSDLPYEFKPVNGYEAQKHAESAVCSQKYLILSRTEDCFQMYWDKRQVTYSSFLGDHELYRYQPQLFNLCCCLPCKVCCTTYQTPRSVENVEFKSNIPYISFGDNNLGYISINGAMLGTFDLIKPSLISRICCFSQPTVIIKKHLTQEEFSMSVEDSFFKSLKNIIFPCKNQSKIIQISKGIHGKYSRTPIEAIQNTSQLNCCFYNTLEINFEENINDIDKLLIYGAFIFLQEYTNQSRGCPL